MYDMCIVWIMSISFKSAHSYSFIAFRC